MLKSAEVIIQQILNSARGVKDYICRSEDAFGLINSYEGWSYQGS